MLYIYMNNFENSKNNIMYNNSNMLVYNKSTKRNNKFGAKLIKTHRNKLKDPSLFTFPKGMVGIFKNGRASIVTNKKASALVKKGDLKISDIYGQFTLNDKTINYDDMQKYSITLPKKINQKTESKIRGISKTMVVTPMDKKNPRLIYDFLRNNNIKGSGKLIISQNGRSVYSNDINIKKSLSKWWKDKGKYTAVIDSEHHAYNITYLNDDEISFNKKTATKGKNYISYGEIKMSNNGLGNYRNKAKGSDLQRILNERTTLTFVSDTKVKPSVVSQIFRDNISSSCFFDSCLSYVNKKDKLTKNDNVIINKLNAFKNNYQNGVAEDDIQLIVNKCNFNVSITDPINNLYKNIKCNTKPRFTVKLINNKCNHLSINNFIDNQNNVIELSQQDINNKFNDLIKNNEIDKNHFIYLGDCNDIKILYTADTTYKLLDDQNDRIKEFYKMHDLYDYAIDVLKDTNKYEFIHNGVNYNTHCLINKDDECCNTEKYQEFDLKKAYTQYKKNKHYIGFPTYMTDIIEVDDDWDIKKNVGYYLVYIKNVKRKFIFEKLGIYKNNYYTFSSIMLLHFKDWGIEYTLKSGCFSFQSQHLDMSLLDNKKDGISDYGKMTGKLNSINYERNVKTIVTRETACILASQYDTVHINNWFNEDFETKEIKNNSIDDNLVECRITFENKNVVSLSHIGGFITDYCRTTTISKMLSYDDDKIIGYKLDGFIIKNNDKKERLFNNPKFPQHHTNVIFDDNEIWTLKKVKYNFNWGDDVFSGNLILDNMDYLYKNNIYKHQHMLITGCGGAGKTTNIFREDLCGLKDCLFVGGNWKLITDKCNEFNIKGLTIHQLIGENCEAYYLRNSKPARIVLDECNTYNKDWIEKAFYLYPNTQFILLGDFEIYKNELMYYQCSMKDVEVIDIDFIKKYDIKLHHTSQNYRCKDDKLLSLLNKIRDMTKKNYSLDKLKKYCLDNFSVVDEKYLIDNYNTEKDWILVSTTSEECKTEAQTKYYTKLLKDGVKHICVRHSSNEIYKKLNGDTSVKLKGEIAFESNYNKKFEKKEAFTIHSFQGLTIRDGCLYFDINRLFDIRQIYTALSRVEYYQQIKILA